MSSRKDRFYFYLYLILQDKKQSNSFHPSYGALGETALWLLPEGLACAVGAKDNVPFAGGNKITRLYNLSFSGARESLRLFELKKMCGGENKKYRRVGNECRLTRCPF